MGVWVKTVEEVCGESGEARESGEVVVRVMVEELVRTREVVGSVMTEELV
jgi:hypothetical protein